VRLRSDCGTKTAEVSLATSEALLQTSLLLQFDCLQDPHHPLFILLLLFYPTLLFIPPYNVSSKKQKLGFFSDPAPIFPFVKQTSGRLSSYV
jgi:hypothetical protein